LSNQCVVDTFMATLVDAFGSRSFNPLLLPLLYETTLHLCDHAKDGQNDVSHLASRGNMRVKDSDKRSALLTLMHDV